MSDLFIAGSDPGLHFQTIPQQHRAGNGQEPQQSSENGEFSWNPLVDKDDSFAQTPDGRLCECVKFYSPFLF